MNSNLPNGTLLSDISSEYECPRCEGGGKIEAGKEDRGEGSGFYEMTCPECGGRGVLNERVRR